VLQKEVLCMIRCMILPVYRMGERKRDNSFSCFIDVSKPLEYE